MPTEPSETPLHLANISAEEALRVSELRYRRLFEAAKDGILILDVDTGRITDVNPFLLTLLGFIRADVLGRTVAELSPFKDIESNTAMLHRLQEHGYVRYDDLPLLTSDGRKIAVEFVSNVYRAGDLQVIQCNIRDVTERTRMDEQLRTLNHDLQQRLVERQRLEIQFIEAQKMGVIGQLAGGVVHDFNNMIGVIMGYSDLIASDLPAGSPLKEYADEIRLASERAAALTQQLLVFSRKQTVQPVSLDLNDVVRGLETMLRRVIGENIELAIAPGADLGHIKADAGQVGQMLMNLVVNARDAMPHGGTLTIATSTVALNDGVYILLSVTDTGAGITDDVKARLFEAFFTTKPVGKGTGLGLATCDTIVRQSGGHVGVESDSGKGATFKMFFPRIDDGRVAPARSHAGGDSLRGTETLLVVEDEPSVRHLARNVLAAHGYHVLSASNGQDALHVARSHTGEPIRLVVTDVIMPLMGGTVMAEWLKTLYPDLKILFTSGYTDEIIAPHGVLEPTVAFLPKPYTPKALAAKVREMLDQDRADGS